MVHAEPRIIVAAAAIFTALAGIGGTIRGLLCSPALALFAGARSRW
ncbi:DUF2964 family protein [Paraburkholderia sp. Clong3]